MAITQRRTAGPLTLLWAVLFFGGLFAVLLGERMLVSVEALAAAVSGLGLAALVTSAAGRLARSSGTTAGDQIGRLLGWAQGVGVVGLALYWVLSHWLKAQLGADSSIGPVLSVVWVSLVAVSVTAVLFGEWSLHSMRHAEHVESSRVRGAVFSGAALALAASYASLFVYAATQQEAKADFSYFKTSKAGEPTLKLVDQLGDKVTITAFFPAVNEVRREVESYLAQLSARNPALQVRLADRYLEPKLATDLKVTQDGVVVLSRDENRQVIKVGIDLDQARSKLRKLDEEVHSALMKLLRDKKLAYLTTGHGELNDKASNSADGRSADIFRQVLERGNLRVQDLGLANGLGRQVPADADVLIILGPTTPFAPEELVAIRRYADGGGKIFLALDADVQGETLTASDQAWRVQLADVVGATFVPAVLADEESFVVRRNDASDRIILPTNRFSSHASVSTLSRNPTRGVVVLGASYLKKDPSKDGRTDVAMRSLGSAFNDENRDFKRGETEPKQEFTLAVAITKPVEGLPKTPLAEADKTKEPAADAKEMRAFVLADADAMSDLLMPRVPGNPLLAFDAVRWLVGEESLAGEIASEEDVRVEQSKQVNMAWFYATVFGVPTLVLLGGVFISRRGRKGASAGTNPASSPSSPESHDKPEGSADTDLTSQQKGPSA